MLILTVPFFERKSRERLSIRSEVSSFAETLIVQQISNHPLSEGTVPVPPNRPLHFAIVSCYLLRGHRFRGCHSGGGGGITCRRPKKSVKKNILRIPHENRIKQMRVMDCLFLIIICDEPRRPKKGRPRGGSVSKTIVNTALPRRASERP